MFHFYVVLLGTLKNLPGGPWVPGVPDLPMTDRPGGPGGPIRVLVSSAKCSMNDSLNIKINLTIRIS